MGLWDFLKRNRRKFFIAGAVVGGTYAAAKFAQWKLSEYGDWKMAEESAKARKKHHFDSNQRTCRMTIMTLLPSVRESLFQQLDTEALTTRLKSNPENKINTWQELKSLTFARLVSSVYSCCLLVAFLRVQLNILGGCMYSGVTQSGLNVFHISNEVHKEYLAAVQHFLGPGLTQLSEMVRESVQDVVGSISLKEKLDVAALGKVIAQIRHSMETEAMVSPAAGPESSAQPHPMVLFLMPPERAGDASSAFAAAGRSVADATNAQDYVKQLLAHTRDVVESADFRSTLHASLESSFQNCLAELGSGMHTSDGAVSTTNLPLARIVPIMNAHTHTLFDQQGDGLVTALMSQELMDQFAANVYEAFSSDVPYE